MLGPVFILGTTRSGTSSLQMGLIRTCGYQGNGEGHLTELVYRLHEEIDRFYTFSRAVEIKGTMANSTTRECFEKHFFEMVRNVYKESFAAHFSDKTPSINTIKLAPLIQEIWPSAMFIYVQRRGIENVISKRKKFPSMPFSACCNEWREGILHWYRIESQLNAKLFIEQLDLATEQQTIVNNIGDFLELSQDKTQKLMAFLNENKLQQSSKTYSRVALTDTPWTERERTTFQTICGDAMTIAGYDFFQ